MNYLLLTINIDILIIAKIQHHSIPAATLDSWQQFMTKLSSLNSTRIHKQIPFTMNEPLKILQSQFKFTPTCIHILNSSQPKLTLNSAFYSNNI